MHAAARSWTRALWSPPLIQHQYAAYSANPVSLSCSNGRMSLCAAQLESRAVLQVQGQDCSQFLQGLITNDVRHLQQESGSKSSLYAFMLNPSGRMIADLMIYNRAPDCLLLECDKELVADVKRHLTAHRLRKKIGIEEMNEFKVWSLFSASLKARVKLKDAALPLTSSDFLIVNDPRLPIALYRVIIPPDQDWSSVRIAVTDRLEQENVGIDVTSELDYRRFRYRIGVSEGSADHPPLTALPLESNGDFLHAISFFKGCYIGQELTARTYHTGVIRKRLMPIHTDADSHTWVVGQEFRTSEGNKLLGKVRSGSGSQGLAVLYVDLVKQRDYCLDDRKSIRTNVPFWWPVVQSDDLKRPVSDAKKD